MSARYKLWVTIAIAVFLVFVLGMIDDAASKGKRQQQWDITDRER